MAQRCSPDAARPHSLGSIRASSGAMAFTSRSSPSQSREVNGQQTHQVQKPSPLPESTIQVSTSYPNAPRRQSKTHLSTSLTRIRLLLPRRLGILSSRRNSSFRRLHGASCLLSPAQSWWCGMGYVWCMVVFVSGACVGGVVSRGVHEVWWLGGLSAWVGGRCEVL